MNNTEITTDQKVKNAIQWIDELLVTEEKQGHNNLGNRDFGYCCLGIGCEILNIDFKSYDGTSKKFANSVGLHDDDGSSLKEVSLPKSSLKIPVSCTNMNDTYNLSFEQIGTVLKDNPTAFFKDEVGEGIKKYYSSL